MHSEQNNIAFAPFKDLETPVSLLSRLASWNGAVDIGQFARSSQINLRLLVSGKHDQIERLAKISGESFDKLQNNAIVVNGNHYRLIRGEKLFIRSVPKNRARFCPQCVEKDLERKEGSSRGAQYNIAYRFNWAISYLHSCPVHGCKIQTFNCETADAKAIGQTPDSMNEHFSHFAPVGRDLDAYVRNSRSFPPTDFERYLFGRLEIGKRVKCTWLDQLEFSVAATVCERLGWLSKFGPRSGFPTDEEADLRSIADIGFKIASKGPKQIQQLFEKEISKHKYLNRPESIFNAFHEWIMGARNYSSNFSPIIEIYRYTLIKNDAYDPKKPLVGRMVTAPEARQVKLRVQS